jgi:hypothetical protein
MLSSVGLLELTSLDQPFDNAKIQNNLTQCGRSTVMILPLQLVFLALTHSKSKTVVKMVFDGMAS